MTAVVAIQIVIIIIQLAILVKMSGARIYEKVERLNEKYNNKFINKLERIAFTVFYRF